MLMPLAENSKCGITGGVQILSQAEGANTQDKSCMSALFLFVKPLQITLLTRKGKHSLTVFSVK